MGEIQRAIPLVHQVYEYMKGAILSGKFPSNEKIVETKIATDLKVSRSPVREAIRLLIANQLLVEEDGSIKVFQPSLADFYEIYDLRLTMEPIAAHHAASKINKSSLASLERNLEQTKRAVDKLDMDKLVELNNEFHAVIWQASGNSRFLPIMENISTLVQYYWHMVLKVNRKRTAIFADHTAIYEAIKRGDSDEAQRSMYRHIMKDLSVVDEQVQSGDGPMMS